MHVKKKKKKEGWGVQDGKGESLRVSVPIITINDVFLKQSDEDTLVTMTRDELPHPERKVFCKSCLQSML